MLFAGAVVVALVLVAAPWSTDETRLPEVDTPLPPVEGGGLDRYRVVYRVEDLAGGESIVSTDDLLVDRPFSSRLITRTGAPPGDAVTGRSVSSFGRLLTGDPTGGGLNVQVAPGAAANDLRLRPVLERLVEQGRLVGGVESDVGGRACRVYRTFEPIGTGLLAPPTEAEHAEVCIDAVGLVLREVWEIEGRTLRVKTAVAIEIDPEIVTDAFAIGGEPIPATAGGGVLQEITEPAPGLFFYLDTVPAGFSHRGRFTFTPPAETLGPDGSFRPGPTSTVDVWERGADFLTLEQGPVGPDAPPPAPGPVDAGAAGSGTVRVGIFGTSVTARPDAVLYVRVVSTLDPAEVEDIAGALLSRRIL